MPKRRTSARTIITHARYGRVSRCTTTYGYASMLWHSADEYEHRFGRVHGSRIVTVWAAWHVLVGVPAFQRTPFAQVMQSSTASLMLSPLTVATTLLKMILRGKPVTWTRRQQPDWLTLTYPHNAPIQRQASR